MAEITLTKQNFQTEVLESDKPVLVDFWATWCGPCRMVAPHVAQIADEYEGTLKVGKVNVDEEPELAMQFQVSSIPTLMVFRGGRLVNTAVGYREKAQILSLVGQL
ncbi:MAG: thioredoxin [Candidatus Faecousia sp.]|nr:thioredoxin [Candidatus Faecousia sp.]